MKVLTVFAHPSSRSFCHAVLDRFDAGLRDADSVDTGIVQQTATSRCLPDQPGAEIVQCGGPYSHVCVFSQDFS